MVFLTLCAFCRYFFCMGKLLCLCLLCMRFLHLHFQLLKHALFSFQFAACAVFKARLLFLNVRFYMGNVDFNNYKQKVKQIKIILCKYIFKKGSINYINSLFVCHTMIIVTARQKFVLNYRVLDEKTVKCMFLFNHFPMLVYSNDG